MEDRFWVALTASLVAAVFTGVGVAAIRRYEAWAQRNSSYFVFFAAGVLITASFLHIIPKSFEMNPYAPVYLLAGYLSLLLVQRFMTMFVCEQRQEPEDPAGLGLVAVVGIGLHSLIDGVIYSVTYTVSVFTGLLATTGMIFHEFPEGVITYLLLIRSGYGQRRSLWMSLIAASLSTPLGMLVSYPAISFIGSGVLGGLLAFSAGALVYVGATHLLPQGERDHKRYSLAALAAGILVAIVIVISGA